MHKISVIIRAESPDVPPHETEGFTPYNGCPLAVTRYAFYSYERERWEDGDDWCITHISTGFMLKPRECTWRKKADALAVLERCRPEFPAWQMAKGGTSDPATVACSTFFRAAVQEAK